MAREFAGNFYRTKLWQSVRDTYAQKAGGLCERCAERGIIRAGEIVHHIEPLTPQNITDPKIAYGEDNLMLVCRDCHADLHTLREGRRYAITADGTVIVSPDDMPPVSQKF